ncbi:hypothetical protein BCV69DRAFT_285182 [Microstroma glucosiphilum]|uniref:Cytochrome b-c1 complex subunit 8 n=1 Tax=Pseudomicrostroma glucosiphilum TaxID=1684307 RepID=A0A316U125_9BASI|nr:hypothetical protein BCV69DRAFT_285182 [Pseudomicrostroma glucosiphilum]PWN18201.1 hypothetical protein BCV69DRAFT_285182 [Pseudomicrostroma glucosiphilum]
MGGPKQRGIVQYGISSNQQAPMHGALRQYVFYGYKRLMTKLPYWGPILAATYGVIAWGSHRNHYLNSKAGHLEFAEHDE